jgi:amidase
MGGQNLHVDGEARPYFQQLFWSGLLTVGYLPGTAFPTGPFRQGQPIGIQAVCAEFDDYRTIDSRRLMGEAFGEFTPPPGFED